jgi:hypothetical protein
MLLRTGDQGAKGQGAGADQEDVGTQKDRSTGRQANEEGALGQGCLICKRQHGVRFLVHYNHQRGRDDISEAWRGVDRRCCSTCDESELLPVLSGSTGAGPEDHGTLSVDTLPIRSKCILLSQLHCLACYGYQLDSQHSFEPFFLDDVLSLEKHGQTDAHAMRQYGCKGAC